MKKKIDSSLLDKAIIFATNAHKNVERKGKGFPYIIHPLEAVSIIATMTNDQELLAAGALHDTVEDCGVSIETLAKEFTPRVAQIVKDESDVYFEDMSLADSWRKRKEIAINCLKNAPHDSKIVALGDKLSNMRAIAHDFEQIGDKVWEKFHAKDPREIEWYYRSLANSLSELKKESAYKEFVSLIDKVFLNAGEVFEIYEKDNTIFIRGKFDKENSEKVEKLLSKDQSYVLDFSNVPKIDFAGIRTLLRLRDNDIKFSIVNVNEEVAKKLYSTSLHVFMFISEMPKEICVDDYVRSGDSFTSLSYFSKDNDSMMKLYFQGVSLKDIQVEKTKALEAFLLGVPTPIPGDIVFNNDQYGITFERIQNKKSFARMLGEDPSRSDELAKIMAKHTKKLHTTECSTEVFSNGKDSFIKAVNNFSPFSDEEKEKTINWINSLPVRTTCLHGDFHMGNVVMNDKKDIFFIDMGEFSYGDPRFDLAYLYFNCYNPIEEAARVIYHCEPKTLKQFWRDFVKHYYKLQTEDEIDKVTEEIKIFAGIIVIYYGLRIRIEPWMDAMVRDWFLNKI